MKNIIAALCIVCLIVSCTTPVVTQNNDGSKTVRHEVDPKLKGAAQTIDSISPVIPAPWGWIASAAAAVSVAVSQTVANHKNKKSANKWEDVATTIIQGVEAAGEAASQVKESIAARSKSDGNAEVIHEIVQKEVGPA